MSRNKQVFKPYVQSLHDLRRILRRSVVLQTTQKQGYAQKLIGRPCKQQENVNPSLCFLGVGGHCLTVYCVGLPYLFHQLLSVSIETFSDPAAMIAANKPHASSKTA